MEKSASCSLSESCGLQRPSGEHTFLCRLDVTGICARSLHCLIRQRHEVPTPLHNLTVSNDMMPLGPYMAHYQIDLTAWKLLGIVLTYFDLLFLVFSLTSCPA